MKYIPLQMFALCAVLSPISDLLALADEIKNILVFECYGDFVIKGLSNKFFDAALEYMKSFARSEIIDFNRLNEGKNKGSLEKLSHLVNYLFKIQEVVLNCRSPRGRLSLLEKLLTLAQDTKDIYIFNFLIDFAKYVAEKYNNDMSIQPIVNRILTNFNEIVQKRYASKSDVVIVNSFKPNL